MGDNKDEKNTNPEDEMSLADLLGGGTSEDSDESTPKRVTDKREDEPESGMVRLSAMVASSSPEQAKTPSIIPPPAGPDATPSGGIPLETGGVAPIPPAPAKSNIGMIVGGIAIVMVALVGGYLVMNSQKQSSAAEMRATKEKEMKLQIKALEDAKAANASQEELAKLKAQVAKQTKELEDAKKAEDDAKKAEDDAKKAEDDAKKAEEDDATKPAVASGAKKPTKKPATKKPATKKPGSKDRVDSKNLLKTGKKNPKPKTGDNTQDLDALLGTKKDTPKEEPKKPAASGSSLPKKPSRDAVKSAMGRVNAKAQSKCAKYSTGTIQIKMVIAGSGKVKSAQASPPFAGTKAGNCAQLLARTAKFPKFQDSSFSLTWPITLR